MEPVQTLKIEQQRVRSSVFHTWSKGVGNIEQCGMG